MVLMLVTAIVISVAPADDPKAAPRPSYAHGTINIALANQNGAVVETDSRLSYNGKPVGKGQKLFKLDDKTVCAIAGFYTLPLPVFAGNYSPAPSSVPAMIDEYLKEKNGNFGQTLAEKMDSLAELFSFDMAFTTSIAVSQEQFQPSPSEVTLIGYEDGRLKILQVRLEPMPSPLDSSIAYKRTSETETVVGKALETATGGLDREVRAVLESREGATDPILQNYQTSMKHDSGGSPSLDDLRLLANEMVRRAHNFHPGEVGDAKQIAVLSGGQVSSFDEPVRPQPAKDLRVAGINTDAVMRQNMFAVEVFSRPGHFVQPLLFVHATIEGRDQPCTIQPLDNLIFVNSSFSKTCFIYSGSSLSIFDQSNRLSQSVLYLSSSVSDDSPFMRRFRRHFPNTAVIRTDDPKAKAFASGWRGTALNLH